MATPEKNTEIGEIRASFAKATSAVLVDFQGLNVESVTKLRDEFRKAGVDYRVCKNTLVWHALDGQPFQKGLESSLKGMTGIAWSYEDPSAAAKVVTKFKKDNEKLKVKAGVVDGSVLTQQQVETTLATMPGKNELRAQLLSVFLAPVQQFLSVLNALAMNLALVLKAKEDKDKG